MTDKFTHRELVALGVVLGGALAIVGGVAVVKEAPAALVGRVQATGEEVQEIADFDALKKAFADGGSYKLTADIIVTERLTLKGKSLTLDLNEKTISIEENSDLNLDPMFFIDPDTDEKHATEMIVTGSGTIDATNGKSDFDVFYIRGFADQDNKCDNSEYADKVKLTVGPDVTLTSHGYTIDINKNGNYSCGVVVDISGKVISTHKEGATSRGALYLNGTITAQGEYIPKITINQGATISGPAGIYAAGYADWSIDGATLAATDETAMEIRAGKLTVADGTTFISTAQPTNVTPNGNGSTTVGAALAIAQHTTDLPIDITIEGGTFQGFSPIWRSNPQNNEDETEKVAFAIKGGTYRTTGDITAATIKQLTSHLAADTEVTLTNLSEDKTAAGDQKATLTASTARVEIPSATLTDGLGFFADLSDLTVDFVADQFRLEPSRTEGVTYELHLYRMTPAELVAAIEVEANQNRSFTAQVTEYVSFTDDNGGQINMASRTALVTVTNGLVERVDVYDTASAEQVSGWLAIADANTLVYGSDGQALDACATDAETKTLIVAGACRVPTVEAAAQFTNVTFTGTVAQLTEAITAFATDGKYQASYQSNVAADATWTIKLQADTNSETPETLDLATLDELIGQLGAGAATVSISGADADAPLSVTYGTHSHFTLKALSHVALSGARLTDFVASTTDADGQTTYTLATSPSDVNFTYSDDSLMAMFTAVRQDTEALIKTDGVAADQLTGVTFSIAATLSEGTATTVTFDYQADATTTLTADGAPTFTLKADDNFDLVVTDGYARQLVPRREVADAGAVYEAFEKWASLLADVEFVYQDDIGYTAFQSLSFSKITDSDQVSEIDSGASDVETIEDKSVFTKIKDFFFHLIGQVSAATLEYLDNSHAVVIFQDETTLSEQLTALAQIMTASEVDGLEVVAESDYIESFVGINGATDDSLAGDTIEITLASSATAAEAGTAYTDMAGAASLTVTGNDVAITKNGTTAAVTAGSTATLSDVISAVAQIDTTADSTAAVTVDFSSATAVSDLGVTSISKADNTATTTVIVTDGTTAVSLYSEVVGAPSVSVYTVSNTTTELVHTTASGTVVEITNYADLATALATMKTDNTTASTTYYAGVTNTGLLITQTVDADGNSTFRVDLESDSVIPTAIATMDELLASSASVVTQTTCVAADGSQVTAASATQLTATSVPTAYLSNVTTPVTDNTSLATAEIIDYTTTAGSSYRWEKDSSSGSTEYTLTVPTEVDLATAANQLHELLSTQLTLAAATTVEWANQSDGSSIYMVGVSNETDQVVITGQTSDLDATVTTLLAVDPAITAQLLVVNEDNLILFEANISHDANGQVDVTRLGINDPLSLISMAGLYSILTTNQAATTMHTSPTPAQDSTISTIDDQVVATLSPENDQFTTLLLFGDQFPDSLSNYVDAVVSPYLGPLANMLFEEAQVAVDDYNTDQGTSYPTLVLPESDLTFQISQDSQGHLTITYPNDSEVSAYYSELAQTIADYITDQGITGELATSLAEIKEQLTEAAAASANGSLPASLMSQLETELQEAVETGDTDDISYYKDLISAIRRLNSVDLAFNEIYLQMLGSTTSATVKVGETTYTYQNGRLTRVRPATPDSPYQPSHPSSSHSSSQPSNQNVPNHARAEDAKDPGCQAWTPIGQPDLFQIDRRGSEATIYFTPVSDYTDRYHVVFGNQEGEEKYGGIAMLVEGDQNTGVLAIDIYELDPNAQYSFKVAPVNDCAVGTWSNWLTAQRVNASSKYWQRTYRYR